MLTLDKTSWKERFRLLFQASFAARRNGQFVAAFPNATDARAYVDQANGAAVSRVKTATEQRFA